MFYIRFYICFQASLARLLAAFSQDYFFFIIGVFLRWFLVFRLCGLDLTGKLFLMMIEDFLLFLLFSVEGKQPLIRFDNVLILRRLNPSYVHNINIFANKF